jgi:hypothetical protein
LTATILSTALAVAVAVAPAAAWAGDEPANASFDSAPPRSGQAPSRTANRDPANPEPANPEPANRDLANRDPIPFLDVPYVLQSEELCGGAAVAMVMRFWGATRIYAESFSSLVDKRARGIKGEDLIRSLHERGWQAVSFNGDRQLVERSLEQRRPPIALIEVRPGRFHYVVILGWSAGKVVVHDPARRPFDVRDESDFLRAWDRSGRWTLVAVPRTPAPAEAAAAGAGAVPAPGPTPGTCGPAVDEAVGLANRGDTADARRLLEEATARCPGEAAGWRELAGLDALGKDWPRAAVNARRALTADRGDQHAARILATSRFLEGDTIGALRAWNHVGEPTLDLVEVRGLERTRIAVAMHALRLQPQTRLTPSSLTRAARRLDALPALMGSRVSYTPKDDGLAQVTAAVVERPTLPASTLAVAAAAVRVGTDREVRVNAASLTGGGELWQAAWRWWENRPRAMLALAVPAPFGGVWEMSFVDERETYGVAAQPFQERRRTLSFSFADWMTGTARWEAGLTREEWPDGPATGVLAAVRYQTIDDRFSTAAGATIWNHDGGEWLASTSLEWRSQARHQGKVLLARAGASLASEGTPLLSWSGAGSGHGRDELLRAHPLLHDGVIRDAVFGRGLVGGGVEWRRWGGPFKRVLRFAPALFADVARAYDVPAFGDSRTHVDAGAGLRLAIPGAGVLRTDLGVGVRDGKWAISVGWVR